MSSFMPNPQGYSLRSCMAYPVHYLVLLSLHSKCSRSRVLSLAELWYLFYVRLRTWTHPVMAPVVRVEPCKMTLLSSNSELAVKVEDIGWMPLLNKFSDSNPEVTRVFALSLVDFQAEVGDLWFRVDEQSIAAATGFPLTGQRWFKYQKMNITEWRQLLKNLA